MADVEFQSATDKLTILRAAWVATMDRPVICDGGIAFRGGRIVDVGEFALILGRFGDVPVRDLGRSVVLPGLVNAHTHLELSDHSRPPYPGSFVGWIRNLIAQTGNPASDATAQRVRDAVEVGVRQCLRFGVTTVGDVSDHCATTRAVLRGGPLRVTSYGEVRAMARRRELLEPRLSNAADATVANDYVRVGVSPHAPYSVERQGYERCLQTAGAAGLPLQTHLAETREEAEFLRDQTGPFRELWGFLNAWDDAVPKFDGSPIQYAHAVGLLDYAPTTLVHVNYCDDRDLKLLAAGRASVVWCPRTHDYFRHPPHRWREMLACGINVAIGTDSCGSSPNLNLVDDLRLVRRIAPDQSADDLWSLVTRNAAQSLGRDAEVGTLTPGKAADFVVFAVDGNDPLEEVLGRDLLPFEVMIGGVSVREP